MPSAQKIYALSVPPAAANTVVRVGARLISKFSFNALRRQLDIIYKRDKWEDGFDFLYLYLDYLDKNKVPPSYSD